MRDTTDPQPPDTKAAGPRAAESPTAAAAERPPAAATNAVDRAVYGPTTTRLDGRARLARRRPGADGGPGRPGPSASSTDQPGRSGGGRDGVQVRERLLDVVRETVGACSRDLLCEAVCERFVDGDSYRFARIDEPTPGTDGLTTLASAGDPPHGMGDRAGGSDDGESCTCGSGDGDRSDGGVDDAESGDGDRSDGGEVRALSERAFRTGDVQHALADGDRAVAHALAARDGGFAGARGSGDEAVVAVPLGHDELVFGVLVVATAGGGLVPNERRELGVVGETVGYAFSALRARELLYAQRVTAVEFDLAGGASFLCAAAAELGCSVRLDSYVATNDGDWLLYVSVSGDDAAAFPAVVGGADGVRTAELVGSHGDGVDVGVRAETPLLDAVAAVGGVVTAAELSPGGGRVAVELPGSVDVRRLVGQLRSLYPAASMRSRTTHDRPVSDAPQRSDDSEPALTDRQREVLEACYRAGYFEWPRESTAEEVADLLGIAAPTLHAHLRKAENALLTSFLDGADGGSGEGVGNGDGSGGGSGDGSGDGFGGRGCIAGP